MAKGAASSTESESKSMVERQVVNPLLFRKLEPNDPLRRWACYRHWDQMFLRRDSATCGA